MNPQLITVENPQDLPILIVDQKGAIGEALAAKLSPEFLTIFVNGREKSAGNNIIRVPYRHKIPNIPDNLFSYIFVISADEKEAYSHVKTLLPKVKENNAHVIVILPSTAVHDKFLLKLQYVYPEVMIVLHGDLFGGKEELSFVDSYLEEVGSTGAVTISKSGLERSYPILFSDAVAGIIRAVFSQFHQGEIFLLMPNFFVSDISLTRMIQKDFSELDVRVMRKGRAQGKYCLPKRGIYIYQAYPIEEKIKEGMKSYQGVKRLSREIYRNAPSRLGKVIGYTKIGIWVTSILLLVLLLVGVTSYVGLSRILSQNSTQQRNEKASFLANSDFGLKIYQQFLVNVSPLANVVGLSEAVRSSQESVTTALNLSKLAKQYQAVFAGLQSLGKGDLTEETLEMLRVETKQLRVSYESLSTHERQTTPKEISEGVNLLERYSSLTDVLPQLVGIKGKKTYIVLFTDNTELRGGGGVVETYGLLTVNKGKVERFVVKDMNELDITMKEAITPPDFLATHINASQLLLKDSLYHPDFPTAAAQANLLYYVTTQERTDGIISVDMTFLQGLLQLSPGSTVSGFTPALTADNFVKRIQSELANNTLASSPQKKEQIAKVYLALQKSLSTEFATNPFQTLSFLDKMIQRRHLQLYSEEPSLEHLFLMTNLSSTIKEKRVKRVGSFADFLSVSEANVGKNNANFYMKRTTDHKVTITQQGDLESTVSLTYANASPANEPFTGEYKTYVQVVAPKNAQLAEFAIDGEIHTVRPPGSPAPVVRRGRAAPASIEITTTIEPERVIFGFYISVPVGEKKQLTLTYIVPNVVVMQDGKFVYEYLYAKQPGGRDEDTLSIGIDFPETLKIETLSDKAKEEDRQVVYETPLEKDVMMQAVFSEK